MLQSLLIKDFALIDSLDISFGAGLTVVTGETGAGKSIIIDALGLVLGDRADTSMVRSGAAKTVVEAVFTLENHSTLTEFIASLDVESMPHLIVRREVAAKGQSRCFLNDTPVNVASLKALGDLLVDVHGQHEHQSLLREETHIEILDAFGEMEPLLARYRNAFTALRQTALHLRGLDERRRTLDERKAVVEYQLREINKVNPAREEDTSLDHDLRVAEHAARLAELSADILSELHDGEHAVVERLGRVQKLMDELARIDPAHDALRADVSAAQAIVQETVHAVRHYAESIDIDGERLESMRQRMADLVGLKRRFSRSLEEIRALRDDLQREFDSMDSIDDAIATAERELETVRTECARHAAELSQRRIAVALRLGKSIEAALKELGISHPRMTTEIHAREIKRDEPNTLFLLKDDRRVVPNDRGWDEVAFFLSTNIGEEPKPLTKVASGGEVSRIMLAIKGILAAHDCIPLLVFDEIDVGVSGKIAAKVGGALRKLSRFHQIVAITHLPQIAAQGDQHIVVEKSVAAKRAHTTVRVLNEEERRQEIARLLSGAEITASSLQRAEELLHSE